MMFLHENFMMNNKVRVRVCTDVKLINIVCYYIDEKKETFSFVFIIIEIFSSSFLSFSISGY